MKLQGITKDHMIQVVGQAHPEIVEVLTRVRVQTGGNYIRAIDEGQAACLYALIKRFVPENGRILEIGTAYGYSSSIMAEAAPTAQIETLNPVAHEVAAARANLALYPNVSVIQDYSWEHWRKQKGSQVGEKYDLIFIDGDHKRVRMDLTWWDALKVGGLMLFHDYSPEGTYRACPPVYAAVNEFAQMVGEPAVLIVDDGGVGMAGFVRGAPTPLGETVEGAIAQCHLYSSSTYEYLSDLYTIVSAYIDADIPGSIVECGVQNGGSAAVLGVALKKQRRKLWLFDTFNGMPQPDSWYDHPKAMSKWEHGRNTNTPWHGSDQKQVGEVMRRLKVNNYHLVAGLFEDTLPKLQVGEIAVLHLDATLYHSTTFALDALYDKVVPGGLVICAAYGHWAGVRRAVDEFLEKRGLTSHIIQMTLDKNGMAWRKP